MRLFINVFSGLLTRAGFTAGFTFTPSISFVVRPGEVSQVGIESNA
jgi:hypothetical protein